MNDERLKMAMNEDVIRIHYNTVHTNKNVVLAVS